MNESRFYKRIKKNILSFLQNFLEKKQNELNKIKPWGEDSLQRILKFTSGGKMIRGGLIVLVDRLLNEKTESFSVETAAALELVQTSLLIHDDIMDSDIIRRGEKTIFYQYKEMGDAEKMKESFHFGEGMGICIGDIGFFLAFEILANLEIKSEIQKKLIALFSRELALVGLGQMKDLHSGLSKKTIDEEEIYQIYRYKTARYTFSLPMMVGALIAGAKEEMIDKLDQIGEKIGILFQIKDDELGLFGNEEEIGKTVGSDLKEEKKTLYYYYLFQKALASDQKKLRKIFGNPKLKEKEVILVRKMVVDYGIQEIIEKKVDQLAKEARELITQLSLDNVKQSYLNKILDYNLTRKK